MKTKAMGFPEPESSRQKVDMPTRLKCRRRDVLIKMSSMPSIVSWQVALDSLRRKVWTSHGTSSLFPSENDERPLASQRFCKDLRETWAMALGGRTPILAKSASLRWVRRHMELCNAFESKEKAAELADKAAASDEAEQQQSDATGSSGADRTQLAQSLTDMSRPTRVGGGTVVVTSRRVDTMFRGRGLTAV